MPNIKAIRIQNRLGQYLSESIKHTCSHILILYTLVPVLSIVGLTTTSILFSLELDHYKPLKLYSEMLNLREITKKNQ